MSNQTITVYEKTSSYCGACVMTKRKLDRLGHDYKVEAIEDQSPEWLQEHKDAGRLAAPIVVVDYPSGGSIEWSGLRPDLLDGLEVR